MNKISYLASVFGSAFLSFSFVDGVKQPRLLLVVGIILLLSGIISFVIHSEKDEQEKSDKRALI